MYAGWDRHLRGSVFSHGEPCSEIFDDDRSGFRAEFVDDYADGPDRIDHER